MDGRLVHRAVVAALPLALVLALAPPAAAHCDFTTGNIVQAGPVAVSRCMVQTVLEGGVDAVNAQLDGQVAFVMVKDFRFHPDHVTIRNGGTVVWVYADVQGAAQHDPRSSSTCGSQALDLALCNPLLPLRWGKCFDVLRDTQDLMEDLGDLYPVTYRYDPGTGLVEKSFGTLSGAPVVGQPPVAEPFTPCEPDTTTPAPGQSVVPYHCGIHGTPLAFNGADGQMRGAITILPEA
ncbi:MAG TPA: hypothetical protein VGR28_10755 [Candidatus Thermoplasmatota archaeon]|jgi:hypothetical protein|nr:hypothetical protein [Candidatus Thermoplasmatota archaeon]